MNNFYFLVTILCVCVPFSFFIDAEKRSRAKEKGYPNIPVRVIGEGKDEHPHGKSSFFL